MYSNSLDNQIKKIEALQKQQSANLQIPIYQVDAFSNKLFGGNPAAVCLLNQWLPDQQLQQIAAENNLAETAFCVQSGYLYELRWFTPTIEVDLCGHATLATAHVLFHHKGVLAERIIFQSKSGELRVKKIGESRYTLDFPEDIPKTVEDVPALLLEGMPAAVNVVEILAGKTDYLIIVESEKIVANLQPHLEKWKQLTKMRGVIVSAKGDNVDFVSRCFFPQSGVDEDPVTGSAHTTLTPYWADKLGKKELNAVQLSDRKGVLTCLWQNQRVMLTGDAKTYLIGQIVLD
jgi:PhzF family phenazine biosynthesis protein